MAENGTGSAKNLPKGLDGSDIGCVIRIVSCWVEAEDTSIDALSGSLKGVGGRIEAERSSILGAVKEWLDVRQTRPGKPTSRDVLQSALLRRLLSGNPKLPFVPPLAFRRPWYALVESGGKHRATFVPPSPGSNVAMVNDFAWTVVSMGPGAACTLSHEPSGIIIRVTPNEEMALDPGSASSRFKWLVERMK